MYFRHNESMKISFLHPMPHTLPLMFRLDTMSGSRTTRGMKIPLPIHPTPYPLHPIFKLGLMSSQITHSHP